MENEETEIMGKKETYFLLYTVYNFWIFKTLWRIKK